MLISEAYVIPASEVVTKKVAVISEVLAYIRSSCSQHLNVLIIGQKFRVARMAHQNCMAY